MVAIATNRARVARHAVNAAIAGHAGAFRLEGSCTDPQVVFLRGLPDSLAVGLGLEEDKSVVGHAFVRCRKCPPCLRARALRWVARGASEIAQANRTWFLTLTFSPENRLRIEAMARKAYREQTTCELASAPAQEQFKRLVDIAGRDVTKALKRLRHRGTFRYLLVAEPHQDGFPHFHALLHEVGDAISYRDITAEWRSGFSQVKLCKAGPKVAWYVCKYLTKSALVRIRASAKYGRLRIAGTGPSGGSPPIEPEEKPRVVLEPS